MSEQESSKQQRRCTCTFGVSPACPTHGGRKRRRPPAPEPQAASQPLDNNGLTVRLHEIVHGSDENCAYGGFGCPIRRDIRLELQNSRCPDLAPVAQPPEQWYAADIEPEWESDRDHPGDTISIELEIEGARGQRETAHYHFPTKDWCRRDGQWKVVKWRRISQQCGPARPNDGSECAFSVCPRPRDGCSEYCWQHHGSQCGKPAASLQPPSQSEEIAREIVEDFFPYPTILKPEYKSRLERRITNALTSAQQRGAEQTLAAIDALRSQGCNVTFWCTPRSVVTQITFDDEDRSPDIDRAFSSLGEAIKFTAAIRAAKQQ